MELALGLKPVLWSDRLHENRALWPRTPVGLVSKQGYIRRRNNIIQYFNYLCYTAIVLLFFIKGANIFRPHCTLHRITYTILDLSSVCHCLHSHQIKCIYKALRTSADISKCCTETQPNTPNSKQCRCRSTLWWRVSQWVSDFCKMVPSTTLLIVFPWYTAIL